MTALEFIYFICNEFEEPCEDGIEFATNNPDLLKAIDDLVNIDNQFICWACWQDKVIGWTNYNKVLDELIDNRQIDDLNKKCAEILKKFVADNKLE